MEDSLATALRHSQGQAQATYDRRTANEKKAAVLELVRRKAKEELSGGAASPGPSNPDPSQPDAAVGQFVGPVAEDSTLHPRRSSWGMSKHSYWTIRSASYGTGTSEEEFTRSNWMAVSGQSPGNRWCPLRWPLPKASHTPSDYKLACGRYTTLSWTVDGIPDLPTKLRHKKAGHLLIKTPQLRGTGMSASCVKIEEKTQKAAPSKLK